MRALAIFIFGLCAVAALALALPVRGAQQPAPKVEPQRVQTQLPAAPPAQVRAMECKLPDCIMVNAGDLETLVKTNDDLFATMLRLRVELEEARKFVKCGTLEVVK